MEKRDAIPTEPNATHDTSPERAADRRRRETEDPQPAGPLGDARKRSLEPGTDDAEGPHEGEAPKNDARAPERHDPFGDVARDPRTAKDAGTTPSPERPTPPPDAAPGHTRAVSPQRQR